MKYFIKSPYWTRHNKKETWWCADKNGYTTLISDAGVYDESEKEYMEKLNSLDRCTFIPIIQKLLDRGQRQLNKQKKSIMQDFEREEKRHNANLSEIKSYESKNDERYLFLEKIAEEAGI